jgi:hypothetical protein
VVGSREVSTAEGSSNGEEGGEVARGGSELNLPVADDPVAVVFTKDLYFAFDLDRHAAFCQIAKTFGAVPEGKG